MRASLVKILSANQFELIEKKGDDPRPTLNCVTHIKKESLSRKRQASLKKTATRGQAELRRSYIKKSLSSKRQALPKKAATRGQAELSRSYIKKSLSKKTGFTKKGGDILSHAMTQYHLRNRA